MPLRWRRKFEAGIIGGVGKGRRCLPAEDAGCDERDEM